MESEKTIVEQQQSCKISVSQKGMWSGEVKVYAATIDEAMKLSLSKATELDGIIKKNNI